MLRGITKCFFRPESLGVDGLRSILELHQGLSGSLYTDISINYDEGIRFEGLKSALRRIDPLDLEDLRLFDRADELLVSIGRISRAGDRRIDVGDALFVNLTWDAIAAARFLEAVSENIELTYAYSRPLDSGWNPLTETKMKRSWLFGSGGVEVVPEFQDWLVEADDFGFGGARGLYPVNFLMESVDSKLSSLLQGYDSLASRSGRIVQFTAEALMKIKQDNAAFSEHVHSTSKD